MNLCEYITNIYGIKLKLTYLFTNFVIITSFVHVLMKLYPVWLNSPQIIIVGHKNN